MEINTDEKDFEAGKIVKLEESVINRIAAGEIIQNPSNCVKELIENSIDAKSKQIQVITKFGGLKSIQIVDNGTGILKENLKILCERFTTSKLTKYDDLQKMSTYGFRGEALASISMISRLTVQTKTRGQMLAYKAQYDNGVLVGEPVPVAGNQGTIITIEDLFYNVPIKAKTVTLANEQYKKILEVMTKYAIHNHRISFSLKKHDAINCLKSTPSETPLDVIRLTYGNSLVKSLLPVFVDNIGLKFKMQGYISKADFDLKKPELILFINHRLVESRALKKALVDDVYRKILAETVHPFIYMAIEIAPENLDVNVSPTKHEVNFLNEDLIIESIQTVVEETLMKTNETRIMYAQQLLPGAPKVTFETSKNEKDKIYAKDMIRTDPKSQSIVKFLMPSDDQQSKMNISQIMTFSSNSMKKIKKESEEIKLTSIKELLEEVELESDENLTEQIRHLKFVGNVDESKSLIQCENILYMVNNQRLAWHLFYQVSLKNFSNFDAIEFEEPIIIRELAKIYLKSTGNNREDYLIKLMDRIEKRLVENNEMLREYFQITINSQGELLSLPLLIPDYSPLMARLPFFIINLAIQVDFHDEKKCFRGIAENLAKFYSKWSLKSTEKEYKHLMENIVFPKIRSTLLPPKKFLNDKTFMKMTSLQDLYKVFERC